jgi:hypothetical protein
VPLSVFLGLMELELLIVNLRYDFGLMFDFLFNNGTSIFPSWQAFKTVQVVAVFSLLFTPIFTYIAILRYRLYEIDIIINRTLVYGSLTATLVALYFGVIVVLQRPFDLLTGERSTLAVVASTLLMAALFTPLRRRIQSFIDRRSYRRSTTRERPWKRSPRRSETRRTLRH